jgi:predicted amidophosphoribosyltransferase
MNIVSGGYAVCLSCSAKLRRLSETCPECKQPLVPGSFKLVRSTARSADAPDTPANKEDAGDPT